MTAPVKAVIAALQKNTLAQTENRSIFARSSELRLDIAAAQA